MVTFEVFIPVMVAVFLAIIGVYVYVHKAICKSRQELTEALKANKESLHNQVGKLSNHLGTLTASTQALQLALTNRLTRIETKLKLDPPEASP